MERRGVVIVFAIVAVALALGTLILLSLVYQQPMLAPSEGLVAHYEFEGNALDSAGSNDGTAMGATFSTGQIGEQAASFDGVNDYIEIPHSPSLNAGSTGITISMWLFQRTASTSGGNAITKERAYKFGPSGNGKYEFVLESTTSGWGEQFFLSTSPVILNEWVNIIVTYSFDSSRDVSLTRMYINGGDPDIASNDAIKGALEFNTEPLWIGRGATPFFDGEIDDVKIWNRALQNDEVQEVYSGIAPPTAECELNTDCETNEICSSGVCITDEEPGPGPGPAAIQMCGELSSEVINKTQDLINAGETVIFEEYKVILEGEYFVTPGTLGVADGNVLELVRVFNSSGIIDDKIELQDQPPNPPNNYNATIIGEGLGLIDIAELRYILTYKDDINIADDEYMRINFPQSPIAEIWTFEGCYVSSCTPTTTCANAWGACLNNQQNRTCNNGCGGTTTDTRTCSTCAVWEPRNTTCVGESYTVYYENTNTSTSCTNPGPIPANQTIVFDCDGNGIIGRIRDIDDHNIDDIEIEIEGDELDLNETYTGTRDIEILEDGELRVIFEWDFDDEPLNLKGIELRKQKSFDDYGYLIVNGLEAEKEIRVDRIADTDGVCIEERIDISSIKAISKDCDKSREEFIECPGASDDDDVECLIIGDMLRITGLRHSAVTEYDDSYVPPTCTESWTYGSWGTCSGGQQTRTATDSNDCGTTSNRQTLSRTCGGSGCTPNWNCGDYPSECPSSGTETRTCTDSNNCGTTDRPTESRTCKESEKSNTLLIIGLVVGVLLIIGVIILVLALSGKRKRQEAEMRRPPTPTNIVTEQQPGQRRQF